MVMPERSELDFRRDLELMLWNVPEELSGQVLANEEELRKKVREIKITEPVSTIQEDGMTVFKVKREVLASPSKIAYACPGCKKVVASAPRIETKNTIAPLSGSKSLVYYCVHCETQMAERVIEYS